MPSEPTRFIIKGIVIDTNIGQNVYNRWGHGQLINIKVSEFWPKDAIINDTLTIIDDELSCAVHFVKDSTYLIGAYDAHRYLATSSCEGTILFSEWADQITKLGQSGTPKTDKQFRFNSESPLESEPNLSLPKWIVITLVISIILNIALIVWRIKKASA